MANSLDAEINKYLPFLGNDEKKSLLSTIRSFLTLKKNTGIAAPPDKKPTIDYSAYKFPASKIKFDRDEINER
ncbi:MAG: hypothetical protein V4649_10010 [Bacteroidota bacterium]